MNDHTDKLFWRMALAFFCCESIIVVLAFWKILDIVLWFWRKCEF